MQRAWFWLTWQIKHIIGVVMHVLLPGTWSVYQDETTERLAWERRPRRRTRSSA